MWKSHDFENNIGQLKYSNCKALKLDGLSFTYTRMFKRRRQVIVLVVQVLKADKRKKNLLSRVQRKCSECTYNREFGMSKHGSNSFFILQFFLYFIYIFVWEKVWFSPSSPWYQQMTPLCVHEAAAWWPCLFRMPVPCFAIRCLSLGEI